MPTTVPKVSRVEPQDLHGNLVLFARLLGVADPQFKPAAELQDEINKILVSANIQTVTLKQKIGQLDVIEAFSQMMPPAPPNPPPAPPSPPVNLSLPTISGTAQVGQTLTATTGTWTNPQPTSFTFQWKRAGTPITGATAQTYVPVTADIGNTITVAVVGINSAGPSAAATSAATAAVVAQPIPVNTAIPTISGTTQVGQVLTAAPGTWTNSPTSYSYQWQREGFNIGGATNQTYTLLQGDNAGLINVKVVANNAGGASLAATSLTAGPVISNVVRYVSQSAGNDSWDGTAPAFVNGTVGPWKTLSKVNNTTIAAGTSVLFKRGDTWRDGNNGTLSGLHAARLNVQSGTTNVPNVYDAYGTGAQPIFMGSVKADQSGDWVNIGGNIWTSTSVFQPTGGTNGRPVENANDIGLVTYGSFPGPRTVCQMVDLPGQSDASLTTQGKWLFNTTDWKVHIYSVGNPATAMPGLELGMDADVLYVDFKSDVIVQNITVYHTAGHGLASGGPGNRVIVRDCTFGWIGGGNLNGDGTRYGNGLQISGGATFVTVDRCWLFECYDGNIVIENISQNSITFDNIIVRNNVIYNGPTLIALNNGGASGCVTSNIYIYNNTCSNPAGNTNRPAGNGNQHYHLSIIGVLPTGEFKVENNTFTYGGNLVGTQSIGFGIQTYTWGQGLAIFDYNDWQILNNNGNAIHQWNPALDSLTISAWAAAYSPPAETHGLLQVEPQYKDYTSGDLCPVNLQPATGSPLFNAGVNLFNQGVVWDFYKNPRPATGPFTIGAFQ
jgi:hypothetical protein